LRLEISKALSVEPQKNAIKSQIEELLSQIQSGRTSGAVFGGDRDRAAFVELENQLRNIAKTANFTQQQLDAVIGKRNAFGKQVIADQDPIEALFRSGESAFGDEIVKIDGILARLQQLGGLPKTDTSVQQEQLRRFDALLKANPAGQFQGAATAIGTAATSSERVALAWERAAVASQSVGSFSPQVTAMNASPQPQSTGRITNNSSTINIDGITVKNPATAARVRDIVTEINRLQRRGVTK
jgi:hypothetical protein